MTLVLIIGSGAVGKMTVGQELSKITDIQLFHNHMTIEPVIDIFGYCNRAVVNKWRWAVFEEFANLKESLIFTYMWDFDSPNDWSFVDKLTTMFKTAGANVVCVELVADQNVRLQRNATENRLRNKASKRDLETSEQRLLRADNEHRLISNTGEVPFNNYIKIDNTNIEPEIVAQMIKETFSL